MQAQPQSLNSLPNLEDQEEINDSQIHSQQGDNIQLMVELPPIISSRNSLSDTQAAPHYSPLSQSIPMSPEKTQINLISVLHLRPNDDEATPLPKISEQDDKVSSPAHKKDKYKIEDQSPSNRRSSLSHNLKTFDRDIKSNRSLIKGSKLKMFLSSFILILMFVNVAIIVLFSVYFSHTEETALISANGALSYIAASLTADPILDIKAGSYCPPNYDNLLLGIWPGTTPGCECSTYLRSGVCRKTGKGASEASCNDISSIGPINVYDWSGSEWCVLKAKPGSYYKKAVICAEGFRKCSPGICVLEGFDCPVTKVEIVRGTILTEKVEGESPVIGFSVTPNDIPCFSYDHFASGPVAPYVLINANEEGCGKYGSDNQHSFVLGRQKQSKIFEQNYFPMSVYSLPDYAQVYEKTNSVLSYRRRLSVSENAICLNIDAEILERPSSVTEHLKKLLQGSLTAAFFIHGFFVVVIAGGVCLKICVQKSLRKALEGENKSKVWIILYFIGAITEYIAFIVMFAATVHYRTKMIGVKDYLMGLADAGCFLDLQAQAVVSDFETVVDVVIENFFKYSLSLFLTGSFAVLSCGYLLWKLRIKIRSQVE